MSKVICPDCQQEVETETVSSGTILYKGHLKPGVTVATQQNDGICPKGGLPIANSDK